MDPAHRRVVELSKRSPDLHPEVPVTPEHRIEPGETGRVHQAPRASDVPPCVKERVHARARPLGHGVHHHVEPAAARPGHHIELDRIEPAGVQHPRVLAGPSQPGIVGCCAHRRRRDEYRDSAAVRRTADPDAAPQIDFGDGAGGPDREAHPAPHGEGGAQDPAMPGSEASVFVSGERPGLARARRVQGQGEQARAVVDARHSPFSPPRPCLVR
jgi:hypothetical protein